jgi:hypothetical protein
MTTAAPAMVMKVDAGDARKREGGVVLSKVENV